MTALLAEICAIESPSTDPPAVAALATRLAADVETVGLVPELVPVTGGGPILRARGPEAAAGGPPPVVLLGHPHTVRPVGDVGPPPARIPEGQPLRPGGYG